MIIGGTSVLRVSHCQRLVARMATSAEEGEAHLHEEAAMGAPQKVGCVHCARPQPQQRLPAAVEHVARIPAVPRRRSELFVKRNDGKAAVCWPTKEPVARAFNYACRAFIVHLHLRYPHTCTRSGLHLSHVC